MHDGEKIFLGPALASNPSAGNIFPWATNQAKNMHFEDGGVQDSYGLHEICGGFFMTLRSLTMY